VGFVKNYGREKNRLQSAIASFKFDDSTSVAVANVIRACTTHDVQARPTVRRLKDKLKVAGIMMFVFQVYSH